MEGEEVVGGCWFGAGRGLGGGLLPSWVDAIVSGIGEIAINDSRVWCLQVVEYRIWR